ncbi:MAG: hypothetical protein V4773_04745, partial [Verrucomicrobiota bacterium]
MKIKLPAAAALLFATWHAALAAPLATTTAVHTKPDSSSPAITYLKAGTEPTVAIGLGATAPAGWTAVELPGPFEVYVENKDLAKSLDVKPGAPMRLSPKADAGIVAVAEKGDKASITGLRGKWTQLNLEKKLVGYINVGGPAAASSSLPPIATTPATPAAAVGSRPKT